MIQLCINLKHKTTLHTVYTQGHSKYLKKETGFVLSGHKGFDYLCNFLTDKRSEV